MIRYYLRRLYRWYRYTRHDRYVPRRREWFTEDC